MVTVEILWLLGLFDLKTVTQLLMFTPVVFVFALTATATGRPKLHGQNGYQRTFFAARFTAIVVSGLLISMFASQTEQSERTVVLVYSALLFSFLILNRAFLSWYYLDGRKEHEGNFLKVLIIGSGPRAQKLTEEYATNSEWGVRIVDFLDPDPLPGSNAKDLALLPETLEQQVIDEVVLCTPRSYADRVTEVARLCEEHGICMKLMADVYEIETKQVTLEHVGDLPILAFEPVAQDEPKLIVKRVFDLIIVVTALPLLVPLCLLVAILIKLDSPGSVFYAQTRVGLNKRPFKMYKFRSMKSNADQMQVELAHLNEAEGPIFKITNDPRITRVGKILRRTSIDELPQLINVLLGQMSIVGPRPMSTVDVEQFSLGIQRKRFSVKPGLACLREISGRSALTFDQWLELDLKYIDDWTLLLDLKILVKLIPAVLAGDGAS